MTIVDKSNQEYIQSLNGESRKNIGQVFTPVSIAEYMADLFTFKNNTISILDPGAGTGILTAALCDKLFTLKNSLNIKIDAYENDIRIIP